MTLIKKRLDIEAVLIPGKTGQFEVIADGERIVERGGNWLTRSFGAGYPDLNSVIESLCTAVPAIQRGKQQVSSCQGRSRARGRVARAFDLAGITNTVGAPSFAFLAKILP